MFRYFMIKFDLPLRDSSYLGCGSKAFVISFLVDVTLSLGSEYLSAQFADPDPGNQNVADPDPGNQNVADRTYTDPKHCV